MLLRWRSGSESAALGWVRRSLVKHVICIQNFAAHPNMYKASNPPFHVLGSVSLSPCQTPQNLYPKSCSSLTCVQNLHHINLCPLLGARHHKDHQIQPNVYIQNLASHSHVHKNSENTLICTKSSPQRPMSSAPRHLKIKCRTYIQNLSSHFDV